MAIETTPLGFQKPDGNELLRNGDNVIAANAQKAEELLAQAIGRIGQAEANAGGVTHGLTEDLTRPGTYFIASDSPIQPDPANPGFYLIGA